MADVVLLGSSHIVKLKQYIDSDVKFKNFGIENISVEYCGIPGGRLANPDHIERFKNFICRFRPKYAVFQLCGNDIDTKDVVISEVRIIILRFVNILKLIARRHSVKIIACQLLFREKTRHILPSIYNSLVIEANKLLKHELATDSSVFYWNLKGLKQSEHSIFKDGVHLNWEIGLPKYYRNIRGAILCAINCDG